jgi:hypothetical protein
MRAKTSLIEGQREYLWCLPNAARWRAALRYTSASILHVTAKCSLQCVKSSRRRDYSFIWQKGKEVIGARVVEMRHPTCSTTVERETKEKWFQGQRKRPEGVVGTEGNEDSSITCVQKLLASVVVFIHVPQLFCRATDVVCLHCCCPQDARVTQLPWKDDPISRIWKRATTAYT